MFRTILLCKFPNYLHLNCFSTSYRLQLRDIIIQSVSCTATIFWSTVRPHLSSHHSWFIHRALWQMPAETSSSDAERNLARNVLAWIFPLKYLFHTPQDSLTCRKIMQYVADGTTSPKKVVLRILSLIKFHYPRPDLNPWTLGPMASTVTTRRPRTTTVSVTSPCYPTLRYATVQSNINVSLFIIKQHPSFATMTSTPTDVRRRCLVRT
jgi:hypothetical protein